MAVRRRAADRQFHHDLRHHDADPEGDRADRRLHAGEAMSAIRLFGEQVRYALSALGVRDAWETAAGPGKATQAVQDWWGWTDPIAEDATKLGRLCTAVGITPAALFDRAVAE